MTHLIAARALTRGNRILLGHRTAGRRHFPDCWDLPGGHVEADEQPIDALIRELKKEIGIEAAIAESPSLHVEYQPDLDEGMVMDVWTVTTWDGEPTNVAQDEHDQLQWVTADELPQLDLAHPEYEAFFRGLLTASQ